MSDLANQNKALVRSLFEAVWNRGDLSAADAVFAKPEGVQRFVSEFLRAFPDLRHTVEDLIAEGDRVAARFSAAGTHTGRWKDWEPTGRPVHYTGVTIARIVNGKIVEHRTWWDTWELINQINRER